MFGIGRPPLDPAEAAEVRPRPLRAGRLGIRRVSPESSLYYLPMAVIVVAALALVEWAYHMSAVPPGVDPGHWITTSYGFVGLPYPSDFTTQPLLYSPLTFPLLGAVVRITGNPITTGFVFGALLLALYGLSVIHLARRYLLTGPYQVLFVALAVLNGTTLQMLFWGGYPNFLGFVLFNETMVFLLAFLRSASTRDGVAFYGFAALLYLTHDLTFAILAGTVAMVFVLLTLRDRKWLRLLATRGNVLGILLLVAVVGGWLEITKILAIPHPGYLFSNPAAYVLDNVGEIFHPLTYAPMFLPAGPGIYLSPIVAIELLIAGPIALLLGLMLVSQARPRLVRSRHIIACAWLAAACFLPAIGYIAHIDTDYPRLVFFFPLPLALLLSVTLESVMLRSLKAGRTLPSPELAAAPSSPASSTGTLTAPAPIWTARRLTNVVVFFLVVLVFVGVSYPTVIISENSYTGPAHDSPFVAAMSWLKANPTPGSVLADGGDAQRWVEAFTHRNAFASGATWLHFYSAQIRQDEQAYWVLNSHYVLTNNEAVLSFTGFSSANVSQAPMYSVYVEGIVFPLIRIAPASLTVMYHLTNGTVNLTPETANFTFDPHKGWGAFPGGTPPTITYAPGAPPAIIVSYPSPHFWLNETASVGTGGNATIAFLLTARGPGTKVDGLLYRIQEPPQVSQIHPFPTTSVTVHPQSFEWTVAGHLGQLPGTYPVTTTGTFSIAPLFPYRYTQVTHTLVAHFNNPNPSSPFTVSLSLSTPSTSNPACTLPTYMDSAQFLDDNNVTFVVLENTNGNGPTIAFYKQEFHYRVPNGYTIPQWVILMKA